VITPDSAAPTAAALRLAKQAFRRVNPTTAQRKGRHTQRVRNGGTPAVKRGAAVSTYSSGAAVRKRDRRPLALLSRNRRTDYLRPPFLAGDLAPLRLVPLAEAFVGVDFFDRFFPAKAASHPSAYFLLDPTRTILTAFTSWRDHS
jgi:hypothetical protein